MIVKQKTLENKASIIETNEGYGIWFTYFDILEVTDPGKGDHLKIEALSREGEILWEDGIYNGN